MPHLDDVKKKALQYRTLASMQANVRLLLLFATLLAVVGAVRFAFGGEHEYDQFCAVVGSVALALEAVLYGVWHFVDWKKKATYYTTLMDRLDVHKDQAGVDAVAAELGSAPECWTWQRELSDVFANRRWKKQKVRPALMQLLLLGILAAAIGAPAAFAVRWHARAAAVGTTTAKIAP